MPLTQFSNATIPNIPFIDLRAQRLKIADKIDARTQSVIRATHYVMGPEVFALEDALQRYTGSKYAISASSGTDALVMALLSLDVRPGDMVIVPAFTFIATAEAVALLGATPLFVDVLEETANMDPSSLKAAIYQARSNGKPLKGVISVDLYGQPADYDVLASIIDKENLWWIIDAAQSLGATYNDRHVTTYGDIVTTSFFPSKPLGCYGDGGAVFTERADLAEALKSIRIHGQGHHKYDNVRLGINGRLDTIQAAILLEKLEIFPEEIISRRTIANRYTAALKDSIKTPFVLEEACSVWAQYTVRVPERRRPDIVEFMGQVGVPTMVHYPTPLADQPAYKHFPVGPTGIDVARKISSEVMSIPMHPYLEDSIQEYIIKSLKQCFSSNDF